MSFLTKDIELQSGVARGAIGMIVGGGVMFLAIGLWANFGPLLPPSAWTPWVGLAASLVTIFCAPVYVAIWAYWRMAPERSVSGSWARNAMILASVLGATIEVFVFWFLHSVSDNSYWPWITTIIVYSTAWVSGSLLAILLFEVLDPSRQGGPLWQSRQERRAKKGLCLECGYDLRGNTSGVCPECGAEADRV